MNKVIKIKDRVKATDSFPRGGLRGEVVFGHGRHDVEFTDPYGNKAVRSEFEKVDYTGHNIIPIGAYQWIFSKMFNIGKDQETTLRVGDLNDESPMMKIGVPRSDYRSIHYTGECSTDEETPDRINEGVNISAMNYIFGFMIGDGGALEDNMTAIAPDYKRRTLFRPIPFRMSNDGYTMEEDRYYGQSHANNDVISYYIKTFDPPYPRIIHSWVTSSSNELEIVDDTVFSSTSSLAIESYVEINFSIDTADARGYFTTTNSTPRVNEFGLVSGWYNDLEDDYESLTLISAFTRPTISLADGDTISGIYRLYAR